MWKLIKWLILLTIVAAVVLWFTDVKIRGRSLKDRYSEFKQTSLYQEGVKDFRSIVGEALKALGEEISGEVTDEEREELEKLIRENIEPEKDLSKTTETQLEGKTWKQQPLKAVPQQPPKKQAESPPAQ
jgi:hypothetical protein